LAVRPRLGRARRRAVAKASAASRPRRSRATRRTSARGIAATCGAGCG